MISNHNSQIIIIISLLISLALISGSLHIYFDIQKNYSLTYIFKPLTMVFIIIAAIIKPNHFSNDFRWLIVIGLSLSFFGDVFLMIKQSDYFTKGLLAFLLAHLVYLAAIVNEGSFRNNWIVLIPIAVYIILLLKFILPNTGNKKLYIIIYATVIGLLLWQTASITIILQLPQLFIFMVGILLFTLSDSILAYNKFGKRVVNAQIKILATYYIAQILIMLSI